MTAINPSSEPEPLDALAEAFLAEQSLPGLMANFKARAEKLHGGKA